MAVVRRTATECVDSPSIWWGGQQQSSAVNNNRFWFDSKNVSELNRKISIVGPQNGRTMNIFVDLSSKDNRGGRIYSLNVMVKECASYSENRRLRIIQQWNSIFFTRSV